MFLILKNPEIPPLQYAFKNGKQSIAYTNAEKAEVLNDNFSSISCLDDNDARLPEFNTECNNFFVMYVFLNKM